MESAISLKLFLIKMSVFHNVLVFPLPYLSFRYMENSDPEIEQSIDKQLVMIVASCLKICRYLDGKT